MRLNDLIYHCNGLSLERNAEFTGLAYLGHSPRSDAELIFITSQKYLHRLLKRSGVGGVITTHDLVQAIPQHIGLLVHENPMKAFFSIHESLIASQLFYRQQSPNQIDQSAQIHPRSVIADHSVRIGKKAVIGPNVIIHPRSTIGDYTIIHDGSVIGSVGFEYKLIGNKLYYIPHAGGVSIGSNCEIQALCAIDAGLFGNDTYIGDGTKIDNHVHIAHGVRIGNNCIICASATLAGAVIVGNDVRIDPNSTVGHEVVIGDHVHISMGAVVGHNVLSGMRVTGNLAVEHTSFLRLWSKLYNFKKKHNNL